MLKNLFGWLGTAQPDNEEQPEVEEGKPELFRLFKAEEEAKVVGLPHGATSEQIERLTLVQMGPGTNDQDCIDFLSALREALPPHEAKNIIVTRETDIKVFHWKKVEEKNNG
jgi:hypothetical protein